MDVAIPMNTRKIQMYCLIIIGVLLGAFVLGTKNSGSSGAAKSKEVVVFEGLPALKLQADGKKENPHILETLTNAKASEYRCVIVKKDGKYYWQSRDNKEMKKKNGGIYITFTRADGAPDYVRIMNPMFSEVASQFGDWTYMEHFAHTMTALTYWGEIVHAKL